MGRPSAFCFSPDHLFCSALLAPKPPRDTNGALEPQNLVPRENPSPDVMKGSTAIGAAAPLRAGKLRVARDRLQRFGCVALILLVGCAFYLDVRHGMRLGQDHIAFEPIYRLRQSLAVAISRLRSPPLGGYLAYGSIVNVLDDNGFALFDGEPGAHLDSDGWDALLADGPRLDRTIAAAKNVPIDKDLPPQLIQGNELGLADYISLSFQLFGDKISSLYYFFYLVVAVSCMIYVLQFRNNPFLLFVLAVFLGELYFLENYAHSYGMQLATPANSRLFSGLSLLPALHVLLVLWRRLPFRPFTAAGVAVQSVIFAFLLSCRTEAVWQLAMIIAVACGIGLFSLLRSREQDRESRIVRLAKLWPAAVLAFAVSAYSAVAANHTDRRYAAESGQHIIWHGVLAGMLLASPDLRREYVGDMPWTNGDQAAYTAVTRDLEARHDITSPIVRTSPSGELSIDLLAGYGEYDKLARSLALRIIFHHPIAVLACVPQKIKLQIVRYDDPNRHIMTWGNFRAPVALVSLAALLCAAAGGFTTNRAALGSAAAFAGIVLMFASVTPTIWPSPLSVGSLFCYLGAIAIAVPFIVAQSITEVARLTAKAGEASCGEPRAHSA
jgi:hypothetical protein